MTLPWCKTPTAYILAQRSLRMSTKRAASHVEGLVEAQALDAAGQLQGYSLNHLAKTLGWSRGKLRRALEDWDSQGARLIIDGGQQADNLRTADGQPDGQARARKNADNQRQADNVADSERTERGTTRARSSLREREEERERGDVQDVQEHAPPPSGQLPLLDDSEVGQAGPPDPPEDLVELLQHDQRAVQALVRGLHATGRDASVEVLLTLTRIEAQGLPGVGEATLKAVERAWKPWGWTWAPDPEKTRRRLVREAWAEACQDAGLAPAYNRKGADADVLEHLQLDLRNPEPELAVLREAARVYLEGAPRRGTVHSLNDFTAPWRLGDDLAAARRRIGRSRGSGAVPLGPDGTTPAWEIRQVWCQWGGPPDMPRLLHDDHRRAEVHRQAIAQLGDGDYRAGAERITRAWQAVDFAGLGALEPDYHAAFAAAHARSRDAA